MSQSRFHKVSPYQISRHFDIAFVNSLSNTPKKSFKTVTYSKCNFYRHAVFTIS